MHTSTNTRRSFIKTALSASGLALLASRPSVWAAASGEKPRYRFVFANDLHMTHPFDQPGAYSGANQRAAWFMDTLCKGGFGAPFDFVLFGGDMVHGRTLEMLDMEVPAFARLTDRLPCKSYPCVGNHENIQCEADPVYEKAYRDQYGQNRAQYTFEHKGILFVVLNNSGEPPSQARQKTQEELRRRRLQFAEEALSSHPGLPKIIVCHIPLVPMREAEVLEKSFRFTSWMAFDEPLLQLIEKHRDSVLAVLSGHLHLTGVVEKNGIKHIMPSGLASFPHDIAFFDVFDDRIDVRMVPVPEEMAKPYATNLHGKRRHGIDYTDATHPTHELYIAGNPDERAFSLPLAPRLSNA
ncbi:metallophosphoesterase family protein [Geminisphaera colitermitum]|uniref:metallophosphoesterase family protein n=1 Tax=Geminisphaera colitermitum TaxID=1148786 RepID=UPI0001964E6F|nr:metallophosphoesterase [Geminisphaera colitermitum]